MTKALFVLSPWAYSQIYSDALRAEVEQLVDVRADVQDIESLQRNPDVLAEVEVILSGWGMPPVDEAFLAAAPKLKAVLYGAGSIRGFATDAMWDRGILVTSAYAANAVPVAEFCLSQILFSLKRGYAHQRRLRETRQWERLDLPGAYGSKVGIITLGMIGRITCELLKPFDVEVIAYSRRADEELAEQIGVSRYASLEEIFSDCDVVSLHTPNLPQTHGMIRGEHFERMKPGATFINTARGIVVNEPEMIEVLKKREDLIAILDVTHPEPPEPDSPLWTMENVILFPHLSGSMGPECQRMGRYAVDELKRYLNGEEPIWGITREQAQSLG